MRVGLPPTVGGPAGVANADVSHVGGARVKAALGKDVSRAGPKILDLALGWVGDGCEVLRRPLLRRWGCWRPLLPGGLCRPM
jgi:hypothetical protein